MPVQLDAQSNEDVPHAWDEFRQRVQNMAASQSHFTMSAEMARRMLIEHEGDLDSMERACVVVEAAAAERTAVTGHMKWLMDRVEWLKREMDNGGNWQYLQLKREETMYCLDKLRQHIPALEQLK